MTHGPKVFRKEEEIHTVFSGGFGEGDARWMPLVPVVLTHNREHQQFARDCAAQDRCYQSCCHPHTGSPCLAPVRMGQKRKPRGSWPENSYTNRTAAAALGYSGHLGLGVRKVGFSRPWAQGFFFWVYPGCCSSVVWAVLQDICSHFLVILARTGDRRVRKE